MSINGPDVVQGGSTYTWTASVSGGDPPYSSYRWEYFYTCDTPPPGCDGPQPVCFAEGRGPSAPTCWEWIQARTGSSLSLIVNNHGSTTGLRLRLRVRDSNGMNGSAVQHLFYSHGRPSGPEAGSGTSLPSEYAPSGAAPNPFGDETQIGFALPEAANVRLTVYDLVGRELVRLAAGSMEAGYHTARFDGRGLPSGVYVV